jgi:hypothetical protein
MDRSLLPKPLGQPTRRLDIDTQWTKDFAHVSTKEALTLQKYDEMENGSEEILLSVRRP